MRIGTVLLLVILCVFGLGFLFRNSIEAGQEIGALRREISTLEAQLAQSAYARQVIQNSLETVRAELAGAVQGLAEKENILAGLQEKLESCNLKLTQTPAPGAFTGTPAGAGGLEDPSTPKPPFFSPDLAPAVILFLGLTVLLVYARMAGGILLGGAPRPGETRD